MRVRALIESIVLTLSILYTTSNAYDDAEGRNWNYVPNTQYHIQTDEGPERYFRFQTLNGQFRKEKRLADGTVIGTEAWLDPLGYLRYKDYIADHQGFRILKSKMIYVGKDTPIQEALKKTKDVPAQSGVLVKPRKPPNPFRKPNRNINVNPLSRNDIRTGYYTPTTIRPITISPYLSQPSNDYYTNRENNVQPIIGSLNSNDYSRTDNTYYKKNSVVQPIEVFQPPLSSNNNDLSYRSRTSQNQLADDILPPNEIYNTANGFEYYLKRQYHEEESEPNGERIGSFGYIDPFGIRRVIYYQTDPQNGGFVHKKNNRYVGFAAKPYDQSPTDLSSTSRRTSY